MFTRVHYADISIRVWFDIEWKEESTEAYKEKSIKGRKQGKKEGTTDGKKEQHVSG